MTMLSSFKRLSGQLMLGARGELGWISEDHAFHLDTELTRAFANYTVHYLKEYAANPDDHLFRVGLIYHSKQPHPWVGRRGAHDLPRERGRRQRTHHVSKEEA
jgi:hypothetical protein